MPPFLLKLFSLRVLMATACAVLASCSYSSICYTEFETSGKLPAKRLEECLDEIARDFELRGPLHPPVSEIYPPYEGVPYIAYYYPESPRYFDIHGAKYRKDLKGLGMRATPESGKVTLRMKGAVQRTLVMEQVDARISQLMDRLVGRGKWWKRQFRKLETSFDVGAVAQSGGLQLPV